MRDHMRVVVQGGGRRGRRAGLAGVLWAAAELTVTVGVVVLLLVVHQVWWTNRQALAAARAEVRELEKQWTLPSPPAPPDSAPSVVPAPSASSSAPAPGSPSAPAA
ncbi:class E sortase, partial [Streptomyces sp. NPDC001193]